MIQRHIKLLLTALLALALAACASQNSANQNSANPTYNMAMATMSQGADQNTYLLQAAQNYLDNHQRHLAIHALSLIQKKILTKPEHIQFSLLKASVDLAQKQYLSTIRLLKSAALQVALPQDQNQQRTLLLAHAYAGVGNMDQSLFYFTQATDQNPKNKQDLLLQIWQLLEETPLSILNQLHQDQAISREEQGWLSLAILNKQSNALNTYHQAIQTWMQQFPDHPALALINQNQLNSNPIKTPKHITLLLPLTGPLAKSGQAIRNAFFAAYYSDQKNHPGNTPTVSVIDTNQGDMATLYQQAITQGSDFIVGPLTKAHVTDMANLDKLPIPVLALNNTATNDPKPNLYSYSLSPVQEATDTANRSWSENHNPHAVMIIPNNPWGQQIGQAFQTQWQQLGGQVLSTVTYQSRNDLYQSLKQLLDLDLSQRRIRILENTIGQHVRATPIIRQDINTIFVVALPNMARQITPLLKFYYAGDIPVYATSNIYNGIANTAADNDMNGLIFSDMPFVLLKHLPSAYPYYNLKDQLAALYPTSFKNNSKLYAFGLDAYLLTQQLPRLEVTPLLGIYGATGQLTLGANQAIHRKLLWAQMDRGVPRLLIN
jgi:outer membrane PBP1 activator LpoA protein